jgi:DNA-binding CsgD family transcriptional regulator
MLSAADDIEEARHCREPAPSRFHGDHAEAVIELGDFDRAERLIGRMERRAEAVPRPWIQAVSARCRGLLLAARGDLDGAVAVLDLALVEHEPLDMPVERGRTLLSLGRVHRRRKEKGAADRALRAAVAIFEEVGSQPWAARARSDLARIGLRPKAPEDLTETERRVAMLAAGGMTNRTVANETFLAPKTVEKVLSRVYRKLGIASRAQLGAWASQQRE